MHGVLEPGVTEVVAVGVCAEVDENHSATRYELVGTMGEDLLPVTRRLLLPLDSLGLDTANRLTTLQVEEPEGRAAGVIVNNVSELVEKLRNEAKVI